MKVLHIGKYYEPYRGGIETVLKAICIGMQKHSNGQVDIEVLCSNDSFKSSREIVSGIKVTRMSRIANVFSQAINPLAFFTIPWMARKFDLIHIHSPNPIIELIGLFLPKDKPIIVTYHSDVVRQKLLLPFYRPVIKAFLRRATKIIAATENHIKYSTVLNEFREKCLIIPFSLEDTMTKPSSELESKITEVKEKHGNYLLFVGRLVTYKGIEYLIKSLKNTHNINAVIIGTGPLHASLIEQIKSVGLEKRVKLLGKVEDNNLFHALYSACQFVVLPSISPNENFGMVQLEAMLFKKAVITTNLKSGVPLVGKKGKTCLIVEPKNSLQLEKSIQLLANNPELSIKMGEAGYLRYKELYSLEAVTKKHIEAYQNILDHETSSNDQKTINLKKSA